jgi:hypothetical protein
MPPSKGLVQASPDRLGSTRTLARLFATRDLAWRLRQSLQPAVLAIMPALMVFWGGPTYAQTAAVGDRYSGEVYIQPAYRPAAASGPTLSWPGKTVAAAPQLAAPSSGAGFENQIRAPAYADKGQAYRPAARAAYQAKANEGSATEGPTQQARGYGPPPLTPWYQRYGAAASAPSAPPAPAPQSIYDPPPGQSGAAMAGSRPVSSAAATRPPAPTTAAASNDGETARFYSLHRQYGLTPDPDPIPPQFFTRTADLSDPAGPSPVYKAASSSGGSTTAVHAVQADDATSTLGQP